MPNLRTRIMKIAKDDYNNGMAVHRLAKKRMFGTVKRGDEVITIDQLEIDIGFNAVFYCRARDSVTICFPSEQVDVFVSLLKKKNIIPLDYKLPFSSVILEFSEPVELSGFEGTRRATGLLLEQNEETKQGFAGAVERVRAGDRAFGFGPRPTKVIDWSKGDNVTINEVIVLYEDESSSTQISWNSNEPDGFDTGEDWGEEKTSVMQKFKQLAIACIGYINCENIYLERQGVVPEVVNAKRERKGKSRLEPYYVCRIRGVEYDSAGNPTSEGAKHGIRYDVRGHFRRMSNGKTTWVTPHQRGLKNELYVPKTYVVDKGTAQKSN